MWGGLEKILEHVSSYSTNAGKLWYLLVFVFRLIVVVTVGQSVYSDEQSAFRCSTKVIGCDNVCYDRFSKISHIRFWAFQLLAVTAPAVMFHFYSLNVRGRIEKIRVAESSAYDVENLAGQDDVSVFGSTRLNVNSKEIKRLKRRRKSVGAFKQKKVFANQHLVDVTLTRSIRIAYMINVMLRIALEVVSLYFAYQLFHFTDYTVKRSYNPLDVILIRVPQVYRCEGENVEWACGQHMSLGDKSGYVPCWVSRPWEKTIFMCYMNSLSAICCVLSMIELIELATKYAINLKKRQKPNPRLISFQENNDHSKKPFQTLVDETDGYKAHRQISIGEKPPAANTSAPSFKNTFKTELIPLSAVKPRRKHPIKKLKKLTTKRKKPVGIRVQEEYDDEASLNSDLYHSSEYEESGTGEYTSIASVSHQESD